MMVVSLPDQKAFFWAVLQGDLSAVERAVAVGVSSDTLHDALTTVCQAGHVCVLNVLRSALPNAPSSAHIAQWLNRAAAGGHAHLIAPLLAWCPTSTPDLVEKAIVTASKLGHEAVLVALLPNADPNFLLREPLHVATEAGHLIIRDHLLAASGNPKFSDDEVFLAAVRGNQVALALAHWPTSNGQDSQSTRRVFNKALELAIESATMTLFTPLLNGLNKVAGQDVLSAALPHPEIMTALMNSGKVDIGFVTRTVNEVVGEFSHWNRVSVGAWWALLNASEANPYKTFKPLLTLNSPLWPVTLQWCQAVAKSWGFFEASSLLTPAAENKNEVAFECLATWPSFNKERAWPSYLAYATLKAKWLDKFDEISQRTQNLGSLLGEDEWDLLDQYLPEQPVERQRAWIAAFTRPFEEFCLLNDTDLPSVWLALSRQFAIENNDPSSVPPSRRRPRA